MHAARCQPGMILYRDSAYVFGGDSPVCRGCDKFKVRQKEWVPLSDLLQAKSNFNPCTFEHSIFLADLMNTRIEIPVMEAFHVPTETFTTLAVTLPFVEELFVAFMDGKDFLIH